MEQVTRVKTVRVNVEPEELAGFRAIIVAQSRQRLARMDRKLELLELAVIGNQAPSSR